MVLIIKMETILNEIFERPAKTTFELYDDMLALFWHFFCEMLILDYDLTYEEGLSMIVSNFLNNKEV